MDTIKLLDAVELTEDVPELGLCTGAVGTVVEVLSCDAFLVEFSDHFGRTVEMDGFYSHQLRLRTPFTEMQARTSKQSPLSKFITVPLTSISKTEVLAKNDRRISLTNYQGLVPAVTTKALKAAALTTSPSYGFSFSAPVKQASQGTQQDKPDHVYPRPVIVSA